MHAARCDPSPKLEQSQAVKDWHAILQARAKEMKPGARMILVNFCVSKEGYFLEQTGVGVSMWDSFQQAWKHIDTNQHKKWRTAIKKEFTDMNHQNGLHNYKHHDMPQNR